MSHPHTTHRRNLATLDPKTPMDPTLKKQPKPHHQHPTDPDPTIASSTIHDISKKFSKLYVTNHHKLSSRPTIDTHLQAKAMSISAIEETTNRPKSRTVVEQEEKVKESQGGHQIIKRAIVRGKTEKVVKKSSKKERVKMEQSNEGHDPKKPSVSSSLSRNQESGLKEAHEGGVDMKRPFSLAVSGGRRRSFSNSQTELADFFSCAGVKIVSVDMPPFMQVHAVDCARKTYDSLEKFTSKTLAFTLKKEFDGVYGPAWHCIVGTSFGSFVTHSVGGFLYFSMDHKLYVLLFKTTVRRAD